MQCALQWAITVLGQISIRFCGFRQPKFGWLFFLGSTNLDHSRRWKPFGILLRNVHCPFQQWTTLHRQQTEDVWVWASDKWAPFMNRRPCLKYSFFWFLVVLLKRISIKVLHFPFKCICACESVGDEVKILQFFAFASTFFSSSPDGHFSCRLMFSSTWHLFSLERAFPH